METSDPVSLQRISSVKEMCNEPGSVDNGMIERSIDTIRKSQEAAKATIGSGQEGSREAGS